MVEAHATTNHDEVRRWVEERGGKPAQVKGTGNADSGRILWLGTRLPRP